MDKIIISPYTFLFENEGKCYVFNAQSLFFSSLDERAYVALIDHDYDALGEDVVKILIDKKILIYEKDRYTYYYHLLTRHLTSAYSDDTMSLVIAPTTGCNFNCPYCFEPKKFPKVISPEVEDKIIEYISKQDTIKHIALTWYGGEPLLVPDAICRIYDRIVSETDKDIVNQEIISNTYLITDEVIELFKHCQMKRIQVSLDGLRDRHNSTRFLKADQAPTFDVIESNIEKMAKALPELHISIRVNIRKDNWMDFVQLYHKYHGEDWHKNIGIYPGFIREDGCDGCSLNHSCFKISDLVDLHLKFAKSGVNVNVFPSNRFKGCMLQRANAFIIGPEGELYKCWNDVSNPDRVIGSIMKEDLYHYDILMKYMHECGPIREECKDCFVYPICDGGCGYNIYRNKFENSEFEVCSPYKDKENLKKSLLYSISKENNANIDNKQLNM